MIYNYKNKFSEESSKNKILFFYSSSLTTDHKSIEDAILVFEVKDKDFLRTKFMAEAFLNFSEIPETGPDQHIETLEQIHLKLSRPITKSEFTFSFFYRLHRIGTRKLYKL